MENSSPKRVINTPMKLMIIGGTVAGLGLILFPSLFVVSAFLNEAQITAVLVLSPILFFTGLALVLVGALCAVTLQITEDRAPRRESTAKGSINFKAGTNAQVCSLPNNKRYTFKNTAMFTPIVATVLALLFGFFDDIEDFGGGLLLFSPVALFIHIAMIRRSRLLFTSNQEPHPTDIEPQ